jgi:hypothetical protein
MDPLSDMLSLRVRSYMSGGFDAAISRTAFTLKFKKMVGTSPMEYLTRWRMLLDADKPASHGVFAA